MLFNVSIFLFHVYDAVVVNFLIVYLILYFLSEALFYFSQFCYLSVHILMSSVLIYIHVSIFPPVSIFLPALISIFLPVSISIFLPVSISIFLPVSLSQFFCLFRIFCHVNQIVGTDTSCSVCDKSPRSSLDVCGTVVLEGLYLVQT